MSRRLDALIVADPGTFSVSGSSPMRFAIEGHSATIQIVRNFLENRGQIVRPAAGDCSPSWGTTPKLSGIDLLSNLLRHQYRATLIIDFGRDRDELIRCLDKKPRTTSLSTTFTGLKNDLTSLVAEICKLAPGIPRKPVLFHLPVHPTAAQPPGPVTALRLGRLHAGLET